MVWILSAFAVDQGDVIASLGIIKQSLGPIPFGPVAAAASVSINEPFVSTSISSIHLF